MLSRVRGARNLAACGWLAALLGCLLFLFRMKILTSTVLSIPKFLIFSMIIFRVLNVMFTIEAASLSGS
jgi:membrane associated rhomboid family serine protease